MLEKLLLRTIIMNIFEASIIRYIHKGDEPDATRNNEYSHDEARITMTRWLLAPTLLFQVPTVPMLMVA